MRLCDKVTRPSEAHRAALAKLFPTSSASGKCSHSTTFDPTKELVVLRNKMKKKATRSKPYKRSVVVLRGYTHVIPAAGTRKKLKESGRIKKLEFTRNMSSHDVKHTLAQDFFASTPSFLKCQDNKLIVFPLKNYPDGEVLEMSSKESVYFVQNVVSFQHCIVLYKHIQHCVCIIVYIMYTL